MEYNLARWAADVCVLGAILGCVYALLAAVLVFRHRRLNHMRRGLPVPVSILKPLHGAEPRLFAQLASFCNQDYAGPVQIVFGTHDEDDPAIKVVERLQAALPDKNLNLKFDPQEHGSNRKISNLVNMMSRAQHDTLIVADSDIQVGPKYLSEVIGELQRPDVGAVTCLYHGIAGTGIWSQLSALSINTNFLPQVVLALTFRLAQPCFGATIAMRRDMLNRIGGFSCFANYIAEDYAIGEAVQAMGYKVAIPRFSVGHVCFENSFSELLARQIRFSRTIRSIDPVGYAGSIIAHPLPLALIAAALGSHEVVPLLGAVLACRAILCVSVERAFGLPGQPYWLTPVQDMISFFAFAASFFSSTVSWRGHKYRVLPDGRLIPDPSQGAR